VQQQQLDNVWKVDIVVRTCTHDIGFILVYRTLFAEQAVINHSFSEVYLRQDRRVPVITWFLQT
jgi:hypothetical protein